MLSRLKLLLLLASLAVFSLIYSLSKGSTPISLYQLLFNEDHEFISTIFLNVRLPRTFTAFIAGGLLALAGSLMQLLLQNPIADPYVLGISGGAALVTLFGVLLGLGETSLMMSAWVGSLLSMLLILMFARKHRFESSHLLLTGMAIACGFSACISFILIASPADKLHSMLFWLTGDLNDARFSYASLMILIAGFLISMLLAPGLNILSRGDLEARALGLSLKRYRVIIYLLSSLFTGAAVALAGCIGFVGLLVPHFSRLIAGFDYRITLPASLFIGGTLVTLADTLARTLFAPVQIPVGILLAFIGVPVFIWQLRQ